VLLLVFLPSSEISRGFEVHNLSFIEEDFMFELMIQSFCSSCSCFSNLNFLCGRKEVFLRQNRGRSFV
jgi:hypothetical protein